jgi:hypothetical protein
MIPNFENMSREEAMERLKELKKEIRKHELVFLIFVAIAATTIILMVLGKIPFETISIATLAICIACCYGIFKYSEPYEIEKSLIEIIHITLRDEDEE